MPNQSRVKAAMLVFRRIHSCPPAPRPAFEQMAVVEQAVEHGGDGGAAAEEFPPVFHGHLEVSGVLARS
jgi:hypothetical protein